jgi:hypothetical protein
MTTLGEAEPIQGFLIHGTSLILIERIPVSPLITSLHLQFIPFHPFKNRNPHWYNLTLLSNHPPHLLAPLLFKLRPVNMHVNLHTTYLEKWMADVFLIK